MTEAFVGTPFIALTISTLVAMYLLGTKNGYTREELEKIMTKSLAPTGMILLVTAGGGVLRFMLQDSGLGDGLCYCRWGYSTESCK